MEEAGEKLAVVSVENSATLAHGQAPVAVRRTCVKGEKNFLRFNETPIDATQGLHLSQTDFFMDRTAMKPLHLYLLPIFFIVAFCQIAAAQEPRNTQEETERFLSPAEALAAVKAPPGYRVSLFAHEPMVRQPIAMAWDDKGRLWICENDTYAEASVNYDLTQSDRIIILADTDQDGVADSRTVFIDGLKRLTSVAIGYGGVYAMAPPYLYFIPDADGDDKPDGEPQILLDGWDIDSARHNFTNGLKWGPDGWLYGRNGIQAPSRPGTPSTPVDKRPLVTCAIWRFHPRDHRFEVVAEGTTNPWGHDWDEHGQLFFINTVIGHLWHAPFGAHFERMYGEDSNPYTYELIEQTADHVHWDAGAESWTAQRNGVSAGTDKAGGGHAHSGLLIYQGGLMPELRGKMLTVNLHGRRLNVDRLERHGATYVGKHDEDFLRFGDPYFRGLDLSTGPDGAIYLIDWSDIGECHDNDGIHRTSGRIYRITSDAAPPAPRFVPFSERNVLDVVASMAEHGRVIPVLQHLRQGVSKEDQAKLRGYADSITAKNRSGDGAEVQRLRAKWILAAAGILNAADIAEMATDANEHLRVWAVRFACEGGVAENELPAWLEKVVTKESSGLVLVEIASALQRLPAGERWKIAAHLVNRGEFAGDRVFPLMVWYGVESAVPQSPKDAAQLIKTSKLPIVTQFIARRLGDEIPRRPSAAEPLMEVAASDAVTAETRRLILTGLRQGLEGVHRAPQPSAWSALMTKCSTEAENRDLASEIATIFGEGRAIDALRAVVQNRRLPPETRRRAIATLSTAKVDGLKPLLLPLIGDRDLGVAAIRGLGGVLDEELGKELAPHAGGGFAPNRTAIFELLATRVDSAKALIEAIEQGKVSPHNAPAHVIRQFHLLGDESLSQSVKKIWPESAQVGSDRLAKIRAFQAAHPLADIERANASAGRATFDKLCGRCHKLFGEGGEIGPDLTGAQRSNLNYWIDNILDPSAMVAANYRLSVISLTDGRILNGVVARRTESSVTLHMASETITLESSLIESIQPTKLSLMPEGQLDPLSRQEINDLLKYLMSPEQVERPSSQSSETP